ncbi:hypothetical protein BJ741DRAFT_622055 [Chytriomyces cf. hyalinus JEL632]|nr:hypothetical protein BJ741DRAFT_622055 [Chytriomyces cf. hyalinus JEL632]
MVSVTFALLSLAALVQQGLAIPLVKRDSCGDGIVGSGVCDDASLCCSPYGWCGSSPEHCGTGSEQQSSDNFAPANADTSSSSSCGLGFVGNGKCDDSSLCCSPYGWCGSSPEHCTAGQSGNGVSENNNQPEQVSSDNQQGSCGLGFIGNGKCDDSSLCCSPYGWCGSSPEHCGGNSAPVQPEPQPEAPAPAPEQPAPAPEQPQPVPEQPQPQQPAPPVQSSGGCGVGRINMYRAQNGLSQLRDTGDSNSSSWANGLASAGCSLTHGGDFGGGQCLAAWYGGEGSCDGGVDMWYSEGPSASLNHYGIIMGGYSSAGCTLQTGNNCYVLVCNFS